MSLDQETPVRGALDELLAKLVLTHGVEFGVLYHDLK
jgi:hypothetical protein